MQPSEVTLRTTSPRQTRAAAAAVAALLRPGDVIALSGELGAGKTCFVQGAAAALGVTDRVTSPSFLLRREYVGDVPLLHLDVYRLDTLGEVVDLGWEDALDRAYVTFVEWGDAMSPLLPTNHLEVEFSLGDAAGVEQPEDGFRRIVVRPHGDVWRQRLVRLAAELAPWRQ